jgi:RHS repeat-associated protein
LREANIGWYLLGNGYRAYNPRLMRFHSPDSWSPFGRGGLNPYMYCVGDPVNNSDPTGHITLTKAAANVFKFFFGGSDVTGPNRLKSLKASAPFGAMRPENSGEFRALITTGTTTISAPGPTPGLSPAISDIGPTTARNHPGYAAGAAMSGLTRRPLRPTPQASNVSRGGRSAPGPDLPPRYESPPSFTDSMPLWSADTFATSQQPQTYTTYPASPSGPPNAATNNGPSGGTYLPTSVQSSRSSSFDSSGPSDWSSSSSSNSSRSPSPVLVNLIRKGDGTSHTRWV